MFVSESMFRRLEEERLKTRAAAACVLQTCEYILFIFWCCHGRITVFETFLLVGKI